MIKRQIVLWLKKTLRIMDGDGCFNWAAVGRMGDVPSLHVEIMDLIRCEWNRLVNQRMEKRMQKWGKRTT